MDALVMWAGETSLATASFYFWDAGTAMQKSQQGLLQTLLYEVLKECPDLIPIICVSRWKGVDHSVSDSGPWQLAELSETFKRLKYQSSIKTKFCFFIDGLDEYNGDPFEMINVLKDMTASPRIKICLSSRPWNCFEDGFGHDRNCKLYLQELTRDDIEQYSRCKLEEHIALAILERDHSQYQELITEIVDRAQGVFLWVFLVVRSLREGFANGDSIFILQTRLLSLPTDLELFFKHMFNSVERVYQERMASSFQVALRVTEPPLLLMAYSFLDEEEEDPDFAINVASRVFDKTEIQFRHKEMRR